MAENKPVANFNTELKADAAEKLYDARFLKLYDFHYSPESHYYVASRREKDALTALRSKEAFPKLQPDAVSCVLIIECKGQEPLLCLTKEMRYPVGQFLLGVPAGLLDPEDRLEAEPVFCAAKRELREETGIEWTEADEIKWINPLLFSSPGITDESNAMVQITIHRDTMPELSSRGAVGGECFGEFVLVDKKKAGEILKNGRDDEGLYYSVYTWIALTCFVSGIWD